MRKWRTCNTSTRNREMVICRWIYCLNLKVSIGKWKANREHIKTFGRLLWGLIRESRAPAIHQIETEKCLSVDKSIVLNIKWFQNLSCDLMVFHKLKRYLLTTITRLSISLVQSNRHKYRKTFNYNLEVIWQRAVGPVFDGLSQTKKISTFTYYDNKAWRRPCTKRLTQIQEDIYLLLLTCYGRITVNRFSKIVRTNVGTFHLHFSRSVVVHPFRGVLNGKQTLR